MLWNIHVYTICKWACDVEAHLSDTSWKLCLAFIDLPLRISWINNYNMHYRTQNISYSYLWCLLSKKDLKLDVDPLICSLKFILILSLKLSRSANQSVHNKWITLKAFFAGRLPTEIPHWNKSHVHWNIQTSSAHQWFNMN